MTQRQPQDAIATPRRVAIVTLGCGRNDVDTEQLAGVFAHAGVEVVDDTDNVDAILINTCTFIAEAKQESIDTVLAACDVKDSGNAKAVVVIGCMAQRYPDELAEAIPEADVIVGFGGYGRLPAIVDDVLNGVSMPRVVGVEPAHPGSAVARQLPVMVVNSTATGSADTDTAAPAVIHVTDDDRLLALSVLEHDRTAADDRHVALDTDLLDRIPQSGPRFPRRQRVGEAKHQPWAYLKIASGCDRVCTFCAIPSFRGRFRSRPIDELVAEATWLASDGVRELVLVSENTTSYGKEFPRGRHAQRELIERLAELYGIDRIRLMYLQPAELRTELLETIATHPKVASYFDLSLQHVSGDVVKRMARSGDDTAFTELIRHIRSLDPDAVFRSNFILGFPGETEHDVDVLADFLIRNELDWVGFFPFSVEDGTRSATMPDQISAAVTRQRVNRITAVQEQIADEKARRFIGRELAVMVERIDSDRQVIARSYREAPDTDGEILLAATPDMPLTLGTRAVARIVDTDGVDLMGQIEGVHG